MLFSFYSMYLQNHVFAFKKGVLRLKKIDDNFPKRKEELLLFLVFSQEKKKKRIITVLRVKCTLLCESCAEPGTGEVVDGWVEAHITSLPPHEGTQKQRRNLYWHNHVHTSCGKSGGPRNREGQEFLCWWLCSERAQDPGEKKKKSTYLYSKTTSGWLTLSILINAKPPTDIIWSSYQWILPNVKVA